MRRHSEVPSRPAVVCRERKVSFLAQLQATNGSVEEEAIEERSSTTYAQRVYAYLSSTMTGGSRGLMRENTVLSSATPVCRSMSYDARYRTQLQDAIFDLHRDEATDRIFLPKFFKGLVEAGIRRDDPRLEQMIKQVKESGYLEEETIFDHDHLYLDRESFKRSEDEGYSDQFREKLYVDREAFQKCVGSSIGVVGKALKNQLVIPDWGRFTSIITEIFEETRQHTEGELATYIPQLARANPNSWAVSICTVDGQRKSWGDAYKSFCLQSVSKPFTYALVHDEIGPEKLHTFTGQEPSGRLFNEICLDYNKKPHNPLINAGAIIVASLMKMGASLSDRFDYIRRFSGTGYVGFNNAVFLSERETADRNYALYYYMKEHGCFPPETHLRDTMDLYFQLCSIETNCDTLAVMAATLANGGVNPMNGERVINNRACRDVLSLMYSCGMYDWSGQFAFRVGLPAKSGVSGDMIIVIPNVMGIAIYSPPLDNLGNTVRGVKLAEALISRFSFHNYDSLVYSDCQKIDPRKSLVEITQDNSFRFLYAAKMGDISAIKRFLLLGMNIHDRDYDERTALHIAASEGDLGCLQFLLTKWKESPEPKDRFGKTPMDDAKFFKHQECVEVLRQAAERWIITEQD